MKPSRPLLLILITLIGTGSVVWAGASKPAISELMLEIRDDTLVISYRVTQAFPESVRVRIENGITLSFIHRLRLMKERTWWLDKSILEKNIITTIHYDVLTKQYFLKREMPGSETEKWSTDSFADAARWMTEIRETPLCSTSRCRGIAVYIEVKCKLLNRRLWHILPRDVGTEWTKKPVIF